MKSWMLALAIASVGAVQAEVSSTPLAYQEADTKCAGELFRDTTASSVRGGILVFHQWTGISDHERAAARKLAGQGFVVLCADVYGEGIRPSSPEACQAEVAKYKGNRPLLRRRARAALDALRTSVQLGRLPVVAIGYCFGGTAALELARDGADLQDVVTFHGGLSTTMPAKAGEVKAKILALHGADDPYVPKEEVDAFAAEMKAAGAECRVVKYEGAVHSFTIESAGNDPSAGAAYNEKAAKASWNELEKVLKRIGK